MSTPAPEPLLDPARLIARQQPVVLRGLVRDWPLVAKGLEGPETAVAYLKSFYTGTAVVGYSGPPEIGGRFFYNVDMTAMNFTATRVKLDAFLDRMLATRDDGLWAASMTGHEKPRQSGKGDSVEVVELWGLTQRAERILHTIHDAVLLATETQSRMLSLLDRNTVRRAAACAAGIPGIVVVVDVGVVVSPAALHVFPFVTFVWSGRLPMIFAM